MSVDVRTRTDGPIASVEPAQFFAADLPAWFDDAAARLAPAARWMQPAPLTISIDGREWTLRSEDGRLQAMDGGGGGSELRLVLSADDLTDLVADLVTPMAWFISGALDSTARLELLLDWWVLLRAGIDGLTPYVPGASAPLSFDRADGSPLDLSRSFRPDDDPAEMAWFLEQAGFLHITGLFSSQEMATISADMDRAAPGYARGDGRSWWARTDDGTDRLVRMQGFEGESAAAAGLIADARFLGLADIPDAGHQFASFGPSRVEALVKPLSVVEGISDVPWHKDCANGRHSYDCCGVTVGISVTGADAASGQLRVVAGSHRAHVWPSFVRKGQDLPMLDLATSTGDVTLHLSCTTHMAQPPVSDERRVLYTGFGLPSADPEASRAGRARLRLAREAAPVTVSQAPVRTSG